MYRGFTKQKDIGYSMKDARFLCPPYFVIQWHLTERCNWRCKHCYQNGRKVKELSFRELKSILPQCLELFEALQIKPGFARINIGGGEPFLRNDFFKFLSLLTKYKRSVKSIIMTNGELITDAIAKDLKKMGMFSVQVSLEGLRQTNDAIRGNGAFDTAIRAIKLLRKNKVITRVSLTLTKMNLSEVDGLARYLKELGINSLGIRRYVGLGRGKLLKESMLSPLEQEDFYFKKENLKKELNEKGKFFFSDGCEDGISALGGWPSERMNCIKNCSVINGRHLNIFTNGDILTCRRFPVVLGNALKDTLLDVHFSSNKLWTFRNLNNAHPLCKKCPEFRFCLGGAKCVSYAYFRNDSVPDPQCWRIFKKLPPVNLFDGHQARQNS